MSGAPPEITADRVIRLYGAIEPESALAVVEELLRHDQESVDPILFYISSPGGCVTSGFSIIDVMKHVRAPVRTIGIGMVASMAAVIFASGDRGYRCLLPHSRYMLHGLRGAANGRTTELESYSELQSGFERTMEDLLGELTGKSRSAIRRLLAKERFLRPEQVVALGLADQILHPAK